MRSSALGSRESELSRRSFLALSAAVVSLPCLDRMASMHPILLGLAGDNPFTLGVASGDPTPTGVVLWTRLALKPLEVDGGMPAESIELEWVVAHDEALINVARKGKILAGADMGHAVHVEVEGLEPDRWYFYGFRTRSSQSPTGRTRTMPRVDASPERLKFAFASCHHFEQGFYSAYEQMAADSPDMVFFLGDYIYEYAEKPKTDEKDARVRFHVGPKLQQIGDYRRRHAQYRSDPLLQRAHATCPWWVTWDDHEVENNYANLVSSLKDVDPIAFAQQRANAYRAYYENMPLRPSAMPKGPDMTLYRRGQFGKLLDFTVLDTRQYRTDQPNGDGHRQLNDAALSPLNTILGARQRNWLESSLVDSKATWNLLAQQVMMGLVAFRTKTEGERTYSMDQWPGYTDERIKLMRFMADRKINNPIVITGDIHSNWVNDLRVDDRDSRSPVVGVEFVGTSISSGGAGTAVPKTLSNLMADNAGLRWHNAERGYVRCTVTPKTWKSDYIVVDSVLKPNGSTLVRKSFVVEAGRPGVQVS